MNCHIFDLLIVENQQKEEQGQKRVRLQYAMRDKEGLLSDRGGCGVQRAGE
jgi:hypothetical protein